MLLRVEALPSALLLAWHGCVGEGVAAAGRRLAAPACGHPICIWSQAPEAVAAWLCGRPHPALLFLPLQGF